MRCHVVAALTAILFGAASHAASGVSLCNLTADPGAYDRKVIEITAFVSHGFENFMLFDPNCPEAPPVWLEYGGTFSSGTVYCCGPNGERSRPKPLVVENIVTSIVKDRNLKQFDAAIQRNPDAVAHATLRGRFFAGEKKQLPGGTFWVGYGHFGLFSLFIIEQVVTVDTQSLRDIDYRAFPDQPAIDGAGCFSKHLDGVSYTEGIEQQRQAEGGTFSWRFSDAVRVATESLASAVAGRPGLRLKEVRKRQGRAVYEGSLPGKRNKYMVVVSRPYWLTFFAADRHHVIWVPVGVFESGCDENEK